MRRGRGEFGCLLTIIAVIAVISLGTTISEVAYRYFRFRDAMRQEVRFAQRRPDHMIKARLQAFADSIALPPDAGRVGIIRTESGLRVWSEYDEVVSIGPFARRIRLHPSAGEPR